MKLEGAEAIAQLQELAKLVKEAPIRDHSAPPPSVSVTAATTAHPAVRS
jgi:hypothetical protein